MFSAAQIKATFEGSNRHATTRLYEHLQTLGRVGILAVNLLRAQKYSGRAKKYRGGNGRGSFKSQAYDTKQWSLRNLCALLGNHAQALGVEWGWKEDPAQPVYRWVLYVELPCGQVSFHAENPLCDHRFAGDWDRSHASEERILAFASSLVSVPVAATAAALPLT